jgi:hypothetical protein
VANAEVRPAVMLTMEERDALVVAHLAEESDVFQDVEADSFEPSDLESVCAAAPVVVRRKLARSSGSFSTTLKVCGELVLRDPPEAVG